ncbi:GPP34 family phosphoprotein [Cohnella sp. GCM10012308]|uniref:GOLPH3/VPS74 family protein n=1 Tax=Cohnella sp. GCM10012308 TaxID=3317329 RepID=UPI0036064E44
MTETTEITNVQESHTLAQEFVLLASGAENNAWKKPRNSYMQTYAAGAILIELLSADVIRQGDENKLEIFLTDYDGDDAAKMMLDKMAQSKPKTMKQWAQSMFTDRNGRIQFFQAVVRPIVHSGDLQETNDRHLLVPVKRYAPSPAAKDRIIQRIRAELLEKDPVLQQTVLLTMMLEVGGLLKSFFSEDEARELTKRLKYLREEPSEKWKQLVQIHKALKDIHTTIATVTASSIT